MQEGLKVNVQIKGMEELSKNLEEMAEHIEKAISCGNEIARIMIDMNLES